MATFRIVVEGLDRVLKKLGIDPVTFLTPPIDASGHRVEGKFKVYPAPIAPGVWAANTSRRQKAAFFAKLKQGGGGRTGQYGGGWMANLSTGPGTVTSEVKNPTIYAGWVGSEAMQARFHRGRWPTDIKILEQEAPKLLADVQQRVQQAYAGA